MAEGVVDQLETIEVNEMNGDALVAAGDHVAQRRLERGPVAQPGQRIDIGHGAQPLLRQMGVGDVAQIEHDTAHRLVIQAVVGERGEVTPAAIGVQYAQNGFGTGIGVADDVYELGLAGCRIGRMHEIKRVGVEHRIRLATKDGARRRTGVADAQVLITEQRDHLRFLGQGAEAALRCAQCQLRLPLRGDVLDGAFVVTGASLGINHDVSVLANPDPFAGFVTIDLGDEVGHKALCVHGATELFAPLRRHIPLAVEITDRREHLGLGGVAVEAHQRLIGATVCLPVRCDRPRSAADRTTTKSCRASSPRKPSAQLQRDGVAPFGKFGIGSHSTPAINGAQAAKSNKRYPLLRHGDNCLVCPKCDAMRAVAALMAGVAAAWSARISALGLDDGRRTPTTPAGGDNDQAGCGAR